MASGVMSKQVYGRAYSCNCFICGQEVEDTGRIYCREHRELGAKRDKYIIDNAPMEMLMLIMRAIFSRARIDYLLDTDGMRADAERFFRSEWAQDLSLSHFDPDKVIGMMDEEIADGVDKSTIYFDIDKW